MRDALTRRPSGSDRSRKSGDRFGLALISIILAILVAAAAGGSLWGGVVATLLLGGTVVLVLRTAGAGPRVRLTVAVLVVAAVAISAASAILGDGAASDSATHLVGALLAVVAPVAIIRALLREPGVTIQTVLGALCLYLLAGLFFAFLYTAVASLTDGPFFVGLEGRPIDYVYFSFTTLTTTGFGDLTASSDLGRMLAITEALLGQLYLVSVVALLVSDLARSRSSRR